jgi:hypothetical protein
MYSTTILQYNCGHSNQQSTRPWFEALSPRDRQVIAIQEPVYNEISKSTFCPRGFTLLYDPLPATRICFLVSKDIDPALWTYRQYGPYVAALDLKTTTLTLTIINIYNPKGPGPRIAIWPRIAQAIEEAPAETLLLGDFNLHHPAWGGRQATCETQAEQLLADTQATDLQLLTPRGIPTWKRGQSTTVIDLTFATEALRNRLEFCAPVDE